MNYRHEKDEAVRELQDSSLKLSETKVYISTLTRRKVAMRHEGRPESAIKTVNKELAQSVDRREELKAKVAALTEKVHYLKKQIKATRPLADWFMDVCRRDLDRDTFAYLIGEANKLMQEANQ